MGCGFFEHVDWTTDSCQLNCVCENGYPELCAAEDSGHKCKTCDHGYHLGQDGTCHENVCVCDTENRNYLGHPIKDPRGLKIGAPRRFDTGGS